MKKIGLGIQELSEFKVNNLIYVDKTKLIYKLINEGKYYFLSRPRRFGKSLLVNTIKELFLGNKPLFKDCWVYDKWSWNDKYCVIKISFSEISYRKHGLEKALEMLLEELGKVHSIQFENPNYPERFLELIKKLGNKKPVVILIDEYDKPIIDYLEKTDHEIAENNREIFKTFYSGIKDLDKYIRFFLITGVSKFSRVSIFSDLNHLTDITINKDYSKIVGYTEDEIVKNYSGYLKKAATELSLNQSEVLLKLKEWYNGYSWDGIHVLYNPYSVLNFLFAKQFKNFWFETGTPTFLIHQLKESGTKLNASINKIVDEVVFNKFDIDNLNFTAIMFQTGYLTIKSFDNTSNKYILDFPNQEVKGSFLNFMVDKYANCEREEMEYIVDSLVASLRENDIKHFFTQFQSLFNSITVKQLEKVKNYEGFYHSIIFVVLKIVGIHIHCEIQSNYGATDVVIKTNKYVYLFEFKRGTAQAAIEQIKDKKYYGPYLADKRKIVIVGISINKEKRNLDDFIQESIDK